MEIDDGIKKGLKEGEQIGLQKGAHQKAIETAGNLIKMGLTLDQVSQATGLSKSEIEKLR